LNIEGYGFNFQITGFHLPQDLHVNDWHKELEYLRILKESLLSYKLPFFVPNLTELFGASSITEKGEFLAIPIYTLSLQSILLIFMEPMHFHVLNHFLLLSIGFFGCYLIKKEFALSIIPFLFLVITFNFYGGFVAKIAAYGPANLGYYFSPFIIFILYKINNEDKSSYKKQSIFFACFLSVVLSGILYQGSLHYFVQWITFLIFWGLFNLKHLKFLLLSALITIFLSMARLLPGLIVNSTNSNAHKVHGYGFNPEFFLQTFISIRGMTDIPVFAWWEFSNYISVVGFLLILIFGLLIYFFNKQESISTKGLVIPLALTFFISFSDFHTLLIPSFTPLLNIESMTTRFFFIIILFMTVISTINFDKFYKSIDSLKNKFVIWILIIAHILFLYLSVFVWSLNKIQAELYNYGEFELSENIRISEISLYIQNDLTSSSYTNSFYLGLLITCLTIIGLVLYFYLYYKNLPKKSYV
jgi:hypothetical protein